MNKSLIKMGAGILPTTFYKGVVYFLLGQEYKNNYWCDFGGSSDYQESIYDTAIREGYEELDGFFGSKQQLSKIVSNNLIKQTYTSRYTTFVFKVDYKYLNSLPFYFNNHRNFIENEINYNNKDGMFEKSQVKLFSKKDLMKNYENIRPFYREMIPDLLEIDSNNF